MRRQPRFKRLLEKIGNQLAYLREKKGFFSVREFAQTYELPEIHYWRIEKGKSNVTVKSLNKILSIHGITLEDFFCNINEDKTVASR